MEIVQELPLVDYILVPIGGGGLATGVSTLAKLLNPHIKVIGVRSPVTKRSALPYLRGCILARIGQRSSDSSIPTLCFHSKTTQRGTQQIFNSHPLAIIPIKRKLRLLRAESHGEKRLTRILKHRRLVRKSHDRLIYSRSLRQRQMSDPLQSTFQFQN